MTPWERAQSCWCCSWTEWLSFVLHNQRLCFVAPMLTAIMVQMTSLLSKASCPCFVPVVMVSLVSSVGHSFFIWWFVFWFVSYYSDKAIVFQMVKASWFFSLIPIQVWIWNSLKAGLLVNFIQSAQALWAAVILHLYLLNIVWQLPMIENVQVKADISKQDI